MRLFRNASIIGSGIAALFSILACSEQPRVTAFRDVELEAARVMALSFFMSLYVEEGVNFSGTFTDFISHYNLETEAAESLSLIHLFTEGGFIDSWGNPYDVYVTGSVVVVASSGPDSIPYNKDDILFRDRSVLTRDSMGNSCLPGRIPLPCADHDTPRDSQSPTLASSPPSDSSSLAATASPAWSAVAPSSTLMSLRRIRRP